MQSIGNKLHLRLVRKNQLFTMGWCRHGEFVLVRREAAYAASGRFRLRRAVEPFSVYSPAKDGRVVIRLVLVVGFGFGLGSMPSSTTRSQPALGWHAFRELALLFKERTDVVYTGRSTIPWIH
jgi:hypothetical protein